jgi:ribose transport system permease protein
VDYAFIAAFLVLLVVTATVSDVFFTQRNLSNLLRQAVTNGLLSLGMLVVILTGGIDLAVGSVMGLSMIVVALAINSGWPSVPALLLALGVGIGVGQLNGLALTKLHLPHPFIATLATLNIARGATYLLSGGVPISGLTPTARFFGAGEVHLFRGSTLEISFPISFLIVILLCISVSIFMARTRTGRHIYAIGGSPRAASYAGINVNRLLVLVYTISGGLAGVAGILLAGRVNSGYPTAGTGAELDSIAAVIIGGASFFGGRGTTSGVFFGAIIMGLLRNGLNLMNVSVFWQQVFIGLIILLAVYVDVLRRRAMRLEG